MEIFAIAVGGAAGSLLRYSVQLFFAHHQRWGLPLGTLIVNVFGSLLIGFFSYWFMNRPDIPTEIKVGLTVGFLGGFTTFSAFSAETVWLVQNTGLTRAFLNICLNVFLCLGATALGAVIARNV